jgi:hypothetical protein
VCKVALLLLSASAGILCSSEMNVVFTESWLCVCCTTMLTLSNVVFDVCTLQLLYACVRVQVLSNKGTAAGAAQSGHKAAEWTVPTVILT